MTSSIFGKDSGIPGNDGSRFGPIDFFKAIADHPDIKGDITNNLPKLAQNKAKWKEFINSLPEGTLDEMFSFAVGGGFIKEDVDHHGQPVPPTI